MNAGRVIPQCYMYACRLFRKATCRKGPCHPHVLRAEWWRGGEVISQATHPRFNAWLTRATAECDSAHECRRFREANNMSKGTRLQCVTRISYVEIPSGSGGQAGQSTPLTRSHEHHSLSTPPKQPYLRIAHRRRRHLTLESAKNALSVLH